MMTTEANKAVVQRWLERAWNQGDYSVLPDCVAADATVGVLHGAAQPFGPAAAEAGIRRWRDAFADYRYHKVQLVAEGDTVVVCAAFTGTLTTPYTIGAQTIPPAGQTIDVAEVLICRLRDAKITEVRVVYNRLQLLEQLGVTP
jgi:predicted ester cyclase